MHTIGILQPFPIPHWKCELVTNDFITTLPIQMRKHDSIMVVVDKLTKVAHFIPLKTTNKVENNVEIYMKEFAKIHGVPKEIVSDKDPKFTSNFWKGLFKVFGTSLNLNTTYHPE
jgi:hypothetical protein